MYCYKYFTFSHYGLLLHVLLKLSTMSPWAWYYMCRCNYSIFKRQGLSLHAVYCNNSMDTSGARNVPD